MAKKTKHTKQSIFKKSFDQSDFSEITETQFFKETGHKDLDQINSVGRIKTPGAIYTVKK